MQNEQNTPVQKQGLLRSFYYAFKGIKAVLFKERNFVIHLSALLVVIILGFLLKIKMLEWISILLCSALVLAAEIFNTAIELLCNKVTTRQDREIGMIKDLAAAAVLIAAIFSAIVGMLIFIPYFL